MDKEEKLEFPLKLWVYGTLKKTFYNHRLMANCQYLYNAEADGLLLHLGGFPGFLTCSRGLKVMGEVYEVPDKETLDRIDALEGHPTFYTRTQINLNGIDGKVWAYVYSSYYEQVKTNRHYAAKLCPSGTWIGPTTTSVPFLGFLTSASAPRTNTPSVAHMHIPGVFVGVVDVSTGKVLTPKWGGMEKPHLTYSYVQGKWLTVKDGLPVEERASKSSWTGPVKAPESVKKQEEWKPYVDESEPVEIDAPLRNVANG